MIVTDCSVCSNVQCLNQVSNASSKVNFACSCTSSFTTDYTCCPSEIMSTKPITIPSSFAQYSNVNVVVSSMAGPAYIDLKVYTNVKCTICLYDCPNWDLNVYYKSDSCCYKSGCNCVISIAKIPASYAGSEIYIGVNYCDACVIGKSIYVNLVPEV